MDLYSTLELSLACVDLLLSWSSNSEGLAVDSSLPTLRLSDNSKVVDVVSLESNSYRLTRGNESLTSLNAEVDCLSLRNRDNLA